ncbi:MAG: hypothetical protein WC679_06475 [Bacteroidales bacterium]
MKTDLIMLPIMGLVGSLFFIQELSYFAIIMGCMFFFLGFRIFNEYKNKKSRSQILLMPVSNLERFLSVFIRAFIYFPILLVVSLLLGTLIIASMFYILKFPVDFNQVINNSLDIFYCLWRVFIMFYSLMLLFFFGSIFYKKNAGIKMGLLMFVVVIVFAIISGIIFKIIGYQNNYMNMNDMVSPSVYYDSIVGIVIALFLIALSYLRLTEEQA